MSDISLNAYRGMNQEPRLYFSADFGLREWPSTSPALNFPGRIVNAHQVGKRLFIVCQTDTHEFHYDVTKRRKHYQKHFIRKNLRPRPDTETPT